MARRLDEQNTRGIFQGTLQEQTFALSGLSDAQPISVPDLHINMMSRDFNQASRPFWDHMLFDVAAAETYGERAKVTNTVKPRYKLLRYYVEEDSTQEVCFRTSITSALLDPQSLTRFSTTFLMIGWNT